MSSRTSLRRSRRAPKKQLSDYNVGDLVEINRNNVTLKGRLAQLLTEGSSVHPRWLVKFEGNYKDEEVYEHAFGKVLEAAELEAAGSGLETGGDTRRPISVATKKTVADKTSFPGHKEAEEPNDASDKSSSIIDEQPEEQQKKSVTFSNESSPIGSESSALETESAKVSAREKRSRRRQAIIDEFGVITQPGPNGKRKNGGSVKAKSNKRPRPDENDNECLKIKLLTGTLYLYRGKQRRAEFIRRV